MKKISIIILLVISLAATFSCSKAFVADNEVSIDGNVRLHISGCVKDKTSQQPLEGIRIHFQAEQTGLEAGSIPDQTVYTDNTGMYSIKADDFQGTLKCRITAEDPEDGYASSSQELIVRWSSLTESGNAYFYNDCNFFLIKK